MKSANYEAPHYAVVSIPLLIPVSDPNTVLAPIYGEFFFSNTASYKRRVALFSDP
jgi:hypothetical protein